MLGEGSSAGVAELGRWPQNRICEECPRESRFSDPLPNQRESALAGFNSQQVSLANKVKKGLCFMPTCVQLVVVLTMNHQGLVAGLLGFWWVLCKCLVLDLVTMEGLVYGSGVSSFGSWSLLLGMYCCCQLAWYDSELICLTVAPAFRSLS